MKFPWLFIMGGILSYVLALYIDTSGIKNKNTVKHPYHTNIKIYEILVVVTRMVSERWYHTNIGVNMGCHNLTWGDILDSRGVSNCRLPYNKWKNMKYKIMNKLSLDTSLLIRLELPSSLLCMGPLLEGGIVS